MKSRCPIGPHALALALLGSLAFAGCAESEPVSTMPIQRVLLDLPAEPDRQVVESENAARPVQATTLHPSLYRQFDSGPLSALEMAPPARVHLDLGGLPADAELRFGTGFDMPAYEGDFEGSVRFRVYDGEEILHEAFMPFGKEVPPVRQAWLRAAIPIDDHRSITLETHLQRGDPKSVPSAGFGALQIACDDERPRERASRSKPNVVFVVIDTLRADRTTAYGYDRETTPNLAALAERGTRFESAWAASPWTWPSTASLMTTLEPPEHGLTGPTNACYLSQSLDTLPERLQAAGWTTAAFSTNPLIQVAKGFDQGFESFQEYRLSPAAVVMDDVEGWVQEHGEWRFFLYLQWMDPHEYRPRQATSSFLLGNKPVGFTPTRLQQAHSRMLRGESHDIEVLMADVKHRSSQYDATVFEADAALGRLRDLLVETGHLEDTVIVVTSDHGEAFLEHRALYHASTLYDEMVQVPMILAGPGIPVGRTVSDRAQNRHLASTLLSLFGVEATGNLAQGIDLLDDQQRAAAALEPFFFTTMMGRREADGEHVDLTQVPLYGVRVGREFFFHTPGVEHPTRRYFRLDSDPGAYDDLSERYPERCAELARMIQVWTETLVARSPVVVGGGRSTQDLLQGFGYVGDEDE